MLYERSACPVRFFCVKARQPGLLSTDLFVAIEQVFGNKQAGQRSWWGVVPPCLIFLPTPPINTQAAAATHNNNHHAHPSPSRPLDRSRNKESYAC